MNFSELVKKELLSLKVKQIPVRKISEITKINKTKVWRILNNKSPIDLDTLNKLNEYGYINIFNNSNYL